MKRITVWAILMTISLAGSVAAQLPWNLTSKDDMLSLSPKVIQQTPTPTPDPDPPEKDREPPKNPPVNPAKPDQDPPEPFCWRWYYLDSTSRASASKGGFAVGGFSSA